MAFDESIVDQLGLDLGDGIGTVLRRFYRLLLQDAYHDASALLSVDLDLDLENAYVQQVLADLARAVQAVAETTRQHIRDLVGQAAHEGWSVTELAQQIRTHGAMVSESRARLIARTESATAYNKGSLLAYQESGVVSGVEWLSAGESCPICDALNGQVVNLGSGFTDSIAHPPAHPGCRCALAPVLASRRLG